jgi:hypothetical protein
LVIRRRVFRAAGLQDAANDLELLARRLEFAALGAAAKTAACNSLASLRACLAA